MIDPRNPDYSNTPVSPRRPRSDARLIDSSAIPAVSIVTPYFNTGSIFEETAHCIRSQTFQQWEWIIINDASTDSGALDVLLRYRSCDPRIRVIDHSSNRGLSGARNTGFEAARAPLVMQIDSDDLLEPTALEKMAWYLETHPGAAFVHGYSVGFGAETYLWKHGFHRGAQFLNENYVTATAMIRKSAHHAVGGYREELRGGLEDWDFWLNCAARGNWGGDIPEYFDWYRRRDSHGDRWTSLSDEKIRHARKLELTTRYPTLTPKSFPKLNQCDGLSRTVHAVSGLLGANKLEKPKPTILAVIPWLRLGGADRFNLDLVQQLVARDWHVTIATTLAGNLTWMPDFSKHTLDIFALHNFLPPSAHAVFLRYLIESRQPDVVMVSNSECGYQLLPYLRSVCPAPAYVDYSHMEEEHWKGGGYPKYGVACQNLLDLNVVASQHLKNWMVKRGADADRIEVATINVDPDRWTPDEAVRHKTRRELGISDRKPVILYAGRLCPQKRPRVFAETMRRLVERGADFTALVAGDGEDRAWLEAFVAQHHLAERVRIRGEQSIDEMRNLILASDVFFLPSEWEGIALSIYEAMAAGLAVVGADVGGQRELVTPDCGVLVPRTDVETETGQYVDALEKVLRDETLRRETGARARRRICDHFQLSAMGARMGALFERAINLSKNAPRVPVSAEQGLAAAEQALEHVVRELEWAARPKPPAATPAPMSDTVERVHGTAALSPLADLAAESELWSIENSHAWRTVQRLKRNSLYRALARLRWGPDWDSRRSEEPATARLAKIKSSNAYRLIQSLKRTPVYRWYAIRQYGPDWDRR